MRWRLRISLLLVVLGLSHLSAETGHIMQKGDTVYGIAKKYGVSVESILQANQIDDPQKIPIGKRLIIPNAAKPAAAVPPTISHRVLKGETFYGLARRYGVTVDELRTANSLTAASVLKEGMALLIPNQLPTIATGSDTTGVSATTMATAATTSTADSASAVANVAGSATSEGASTGPAATSAAPVAAASSDTVAVARGEVRPAVTKSADPTLRWPIKAKEVAYLEGKLYGVWILGERAEPVIALKAGTVAAAGPYRGFGQVVIVRTKDGLAYVYGGCESVSVSAGDAVAGGTALGSLGLDQLSGDSRLFFFVYKENLAVDPASAPRDLL